MLWTYARGDESLCLETRFDKETRTYVLVVYRASRRRPLVERFEDADTFRQRLIDLEKQLNWEEWRSAGAPVLLRDGWKI